MLMGLILFHGLFYGDVSLWKVGRILVGLPFGGYKCSRFPEAISC